jgi:protein-tyrosine phosphatase
MLNVLAFLINKTNLFKILYLKPLISLRENGMIPTSILITCKGNICRSPYAEAKLRSMLLKYGLEGIKVYSRGFETNKAKPANELAISEARLRGIDLSMHSTTPINDADINSAQLILVVEPRYFSLLDPSKTMYLGATGIGAGSTLIIEDPYSRYVNEDAFNKIRICFDKIDASLEGLVSYLIDKQTKR